MSYLDKVSEQINGNTDIRQNTEPSPTAANTVEPAAAASTVEPNEEHKVDANAKKPDLSKISKEEKAEHAFRRQLSRQRERYETQIRQMHDAFQKQFDDFRDEFKKAQPKEQPKTRDDFPSDDEYIKYLTRQGFLEAKAEVDAQLAKESDEKAAKEREEQAFAEQRQQITEQFQRNCRAAFQDEESYGAFAAKVNKGLANGLGEVLDYAPSIRDYLFTNQNGPAILNEMLSDKASFMRIMQNAGNPTEAIIEMHELARELKNKDANPSETQAASKSMPHIGKPGATSVGSKTNIFGSERDLINFIRAR